MPSTVLVFSPPQSPPLGGEVKPSPQRGELEGGESARGKPSPVEC